MVPEWSASLPENILFFYNWVVAGEGGGGNSIPIAQRPLPLTLSTSALTEIDSQANVQAGKTIKKPTGFSKQRAMLTSTSNNFETKFQYCINYY